MSRVNTASFGAVITYNVKAHEAPLSPADINEKSRVATLKLPDAVATYDRIVQGEYRPHPEVVRALIERLVNEAPGFEHVKWGLATSPSGLQKQFQIVVTRAVPVDMPSALQAETIHLDPVFIDEVNKKYATSLGRMDDYGSTPIEAWATYALRDVRGTPPTGNYRSFVKELDDMMAKRPDLAAAVMARYDIRDVMVFAWHHAGNDKTLIERLATHTRNVAPLAPLAA